MEIINLELKRLQSGHDFQSQGRMTLKILVKVKGHHIQHDTPSHASDHLYQIWKESIHNFRCYRVDTIFYVKAELDKLERPFWEYPPQ